MQNDDESEALKIMQGDPGEAQAAFVEMARAAFRDRDAAGASIPLLLIAGSLFPPALHVIATLSPTMQVTYAERMRKGEVQVTPENPCSAFAAKGRELFGDGVRELTELQIIDLAFLTMHVCAGLPPPRREGGELVSA